MKEPRKSRGGSFFARMRRLLVIGAVTGSALTSLLGVGTANAATPYPTGTTGTTVFHQTIGYKSADGVGDLYLNSGAFEGYRTQYSGPSQRITVQWKVWQYVGGANPWVLRVAPSATEVVASGYKMTNPGWYWKASPGFYATEVLFTWRTTSGGFIGSRLLDLVQSSDYAIGYTGYTGCCTIQAFGGQYGIKLQS